METLDFPMYDSPSQIESDESMPTKYDERVAALQSSMQSVTADVASLKTDLGPIKTDLAKIQGSIGAVKTMLGWVIPAMIAWIGWLSYVVIFQAGATSSKIVAEIKSPKSTQQLQANLNTVVAEIQTARASGKKPNEKKIVALSGAVGVAIERKTESSAAWRAATELISYRSEVSHPIQQHLPPCDFTNAKPEMRQTSVTKDGGTYGIAFYVSNCSMKLEDVPQLAIKEADMPFKWVHMEDGFLEKYPVVLTNGEVIYSGGPIQHDAGFVFINCSFDLHTDGIPEQNAQRILIAALKSDDLNQVDAKLAIKPS